MARVIHLVKSMLILGVLFGCAGSETASPEPPASAFDAAVLNTVLDDFANRDDLPFLSSDEPKALVVVDVQTGGWSFYLTEDQVSADLMHEGWKLPKQMLQDLQRRNSGQASLRDMPLGATSVKEDLDDFPSGFNFWQSLQKKHPSAEAYVTFWLPGYSRNKKQAVVRFSFGPTPHGATATYWLVKDGATWKIKQSALAYYA